MDWESLNGQKFCSAMKTVDGWVSYKLNMVHQTGGTEAFKCFQQPWEGLPKACKSGEWTLTQSGASAETHKSQGCVNPSWATAGSCLSGVRCQICTGQLQYILRQFCNKTQRRPGLFLIIRGSLYMFIMFYKQYYIKVPFWQSASLL